MLYQIQGQSNVLQLDSMHSSVPPVDAHSVKTIVTTAGDDIESLHLNCPAVLVRPEQVSRSGRKAHHSHPQLLRFLVRQLDIVPAHESQAPVRSNPVHVQGSGHTADAVAFTHQHVDS